MFRGDRSSGTDCRDPVLGVLRAEALPIEKAVGPMESVVRKILMNAFNMNSVTSPTDSGAILVIDRSSTRRSAAGRISRDSSSVDGSTASSSRT